MTMDPFATAHRVSTTALSLSPPQDPRINGGIKNQCVIQEIIYRAEVVQLACFLHAKINNLNQMRFRFQSSIFSFLASVAKCYKREIQASSYGKSNVLMLLYDFRVSQ